MSLSAARWSFLLLVVSLPLVRPFNTTILGYTAPYSDLIFVGVLAFFLVAVSVGKIALRFDRLFVAIGIYAAALTLSAVFSVDPAASFKKLIGEFYLCGLCIVTFHLLRDDVDLRRKTTLAWLAGTAVTVAMSAIGFIAFYAGATTPESNYMLSHFGSLPAGNYPRLHSLFANANMLCNYLNVSIVLCLLAGKAGWLRRPWVALLSSGTIAAALLSLSAGLGGIALSCGLWLRNNTSRKAGRLALAAGMIVAALFLAAALISPDTPNTSADIRVPGTETRIEPSVRVAVWTSALARTAEFPILGRGVGMNAAEVTYVVLSGRGQWLTDAHNMWLSVAAQAGVVGLAAFIILCVYLLGLCRLDTQPFTVATTCAVIGAFFYQGLTGSYEDTRHIWVLIGMLAAARAVPFDGESGKLSE